MRFTKNKIAQITMMITLTIITVGVIIYASSSNSVYADDTASIKYVQEEMKKVQVQIDELKAAMEEQQTEIETLKTENSNLKTKIEKVNYDSEIKDINNKIKSLEENSSISNLLDRVGKIEAREDYFYKGGSQGWLLPYMSKHILDNLK